MNNSFFLEESEEVKPDFSLEKARLTNLIEAIAGLLEDRNWQTLSKLHFEAEEERVKRLILSETQKTKISEEEIYRLQGEMKWAKKYANLAEFARFLKKQLNALQ